jgi:hypothetical protein
MNDVDGIGNGKIINTNNSPLLSSFDRLIEEKLLNG